LGDATGDALISFGGRDWTVFFPHFLSAVPQTLFGRRDWRCSNVQFPVFSSVGGCFGEDQQGQLVLKAL
jgi:hypothetical protein